MADRLIVGCGYLGSRVAKLWQQQGDRVHVTTRSSTHAREFADRGYVPVVCDVLDPHSMTNLPKVDTCVYCIGFDRKSGRSMRDIYVEGLSNFLEAMQKDRKTPRRFLYISSTSVYAQIDSEWVTESSPTEPTGGSGTVVLEAEQQLRSAIPDAIVLRFAGIYGPGRVMREQVLREGKPIETDPTAWLNLIHVEDGARAILSAAERGGVGETYNVGDDQPIRRGEFYREIASRLEVPEPTFVEPAQREKGSRRIRNRRLREELAVSLHYPTYREGLSAALAPSLSD